MSKIFFRPTDEWGDDAVKMTTTGILTVVAVIVILIAVALIVYRIHSKQKSFKITTKQLVFSAMAIALATVTSMIKLFDLPMGGSVTLLSMFFIVFVGYLYGPYAGILTGMAYGLLQFVLEPIFYTIPQMLVDYPLAFGALGLAGFFAGKKHGLVIGYIFGVCGRFVFAFLSGILFFASYAPEGMNVALYSIVYNGSYLLPEAVITIVILLIPPVNKALQHVKQIAESS